MTTIAKPGWLLALLACLAPALSASARAVEPGEDALMQPAEHAEVVFRHYL